MIPTTNPVLRSRVPSFLAIAAGLVLGMPAQGGPPQYIVRSLVSNGTVPALHTDRNLVNPWGIAFNPTGYAWVANAGTGTSTLYDGYGMPQDLVVFIPGPDGIPERRAEPTGIVFYGGESFLVARDGLRAPVRFMFATESGTIAAWSPDVDPQHAITVVDSTGMDANFKGLAIATGTPMGDVIYAADFHNARVRIFTGEFQEIVPLGPMFFDPDIPDGFAPFGIHEIGGTIYVTYAMQDDAGEDEVPGPHLGFVNAFTTSGDLLGRVAGEGDLNAPWGVAQAPEDFGAFGGALLIGNFGDGRITAFSPVTDSVMGQLSGADGRPIEIEGLWGIAFGNGVNNQPTNTLFFAAGINDEADGLYGSIAAIGCYPDLNGDGALDLFEFLAFTNAFNAQDPNADCNADSALDLFDFLCFTNAFNAGC